MSEKITEYKGSTDIVLSETGGLLPRTFEGLWRMSQIMSTSGLMPKGIEKPEAVFVCVQMGLEVGLSPMQAVQNIAPINGRPSIWGDAMLGLVRASGWLEEFKETSVGTFPNDNYAAVCTVKRVGFDPIVQTFSIHDAKTADLWLIGKQGLDWKQKASPWYKYPGRMLQMRARSWALRDGFGDVLKGLRSAEEVMDFVDMQQDGAGTYSYNTPEPETREDGLPDSVAAENDFKAEVVARGFDPKKVEHFLTVTAKSNNTSVDVVKEQALQHKDRFFASFQKYPGNKNKPEGPAPNTSPPSFRDEWINLRAAGFKPFVLDNLKRFQQASPEVQQEAREKWGKFYEEDFPLDSKPELGPTPPPKPAETKKPEPTPPAPEPNGQGQGNGRPSIWQIHDGIQRNDPSGYLEALKEEKLDNEPGEESEVRRVVATYQRMFESDEKF